MSSALCGQYRNRNILNDLCPQKYFPYNSVRPARRDFRNKSSLQKLWSRQYLNGCNPSGNVRLLRKRARESMSTPLLENPAPTQFIWSQGTPLHFQISISRPTYSAFSSISNIPQGTHLWRELLDAGHAILFGALALTLLWTANGSPRFRTLSARRQYVSVRSLLYLLWGWPQRLSSRISSGTVK